jgi:hypothetical protein
MLSPSKHARLRRVGNLLLRALCVSVVNPFYTWSGGAVFLPRACRASVGEGDREAVEGAFARSD